MGENAPAAEQTMKTEKAEVADSSCGDPLFPSSTAPAATPISAIAPAAAACTCAGDSRLKQGYPLCCVEDSVSCLTLAALNSIGAMHGSVNISACLQGNQERHLARHQLHCLQGKSGGMCRVCELQAATEMLIVLQKQGSHLVGAEMALGSDAAGVHAGDDGLEALRPSLPMRVECLTKFVVRHVGWQVQEACPPSHCSHPHLHNSRIQ